MITIDLVTGFLGSGKTTFIKKYAEYLISKGHKVGILENDYGAVNVDMMLLEDELGENCGLEMVAGACDRDCHARRYKTKLISMAMSGYDRIIVEPSGIFDVDEFFDALYESPLDRWYKAGSVISLVDSALEENLSERSEYLLVSQTACAGKIVLSKSQFAGEKEIESTLSHIDLSLKNYNVERDVRKDTIAKCWDDFSEGEFEEIEKAGYRSVSHRKNGIEGYNSLYYMNLPLEPESIEDACEKIFSSQEYGNVFRIKGFAKKDEVWYEINSTKLNRTVNRIKNGQPVVIVIGEDLNIDKINYCFGKKADGIG